MFFCFFCGYNHQCVNTVLISCYIFHWVLRWEEQLCGWMWHHSHASVDRVGRCKTHAHHCYVHMDTQFSSAKCLFYYKRSASSMTDFPSEADEVELWDLLCLISQTGVQYPSCNRGLSPGPSGVITPWRHFLQNPPSHWVQSTDVGTAPLRCGTSHASSNRSKLFCCLDLDDFEHISLHSKLFVLYLPCLFVKDVSILSPGGGVVANVVFIWPRSMFACFKPSAVCVRQQVETYLSAAFWGWWVSRVPLMLLNLEMIIFPWFGPSLSH